jgi:hypothetical protein
MAVDDVTKKLSIYHILYRLNRSFTALVMHCRALEKTGLIKTKVTRRYQGFTQELQAEINGELLEALHRTELEDWAHFGKVRQVWERKIRDPADALIEAEEQRAVSARRKKTGS